jgi:heme-degrading monooxygenase HmoA
MAVLMQARAHGMTEEQYEQATGGDFIDRLHNADGYIGLHAAGPIDDGYQVFEVWRAEADHRRWIEQAVAPNVPPEAMEAMEVIYHPLSKAIR